MRILVSLCAAVAVLTSVHCAHAWQMTWQNNVPWLHILGDPIRPGGMVQLIADGGNGLIDDPRDKLLGSPPLFQEWVDAGCPPIGPGFHPELGDDFLVISSDDPNPTYFRDYGPGFDGYFDGTYILASYPLGTLMYTRFFTLYTPDKGYYYGNVGDVDGTTNDGVTPNYGFYAVDNDLFPLYIIEGAYVADREIYPVPEPGTMLVACAAILLGVVKMKRRAVSL